MALLRSLILFLLAVAVLLVGVLVGIDNSDPVALVFLDWRSPELPLFVWVCLALLLGFLLGAAATALGSLRLRRQRRQLQRERDALRRQLDAGSNRDPG